MAATTLIENTLKDIHHYRVHPEYLPFIGKDYEKYRILLVGESHYVNQSAHSSTVTLTDFDSWWDEPCPKVSMGSEGWFNTRQVVENYKSGDKGGKYGIFTNIIKSFSKVVLGEEIHRISLDKKQLIDCFAFMNFFQMPALYSKMKYWNSLVKSAKLLGDKSLADEVWNKSVAVSSGVLNDVIDILKPKLVVFVSVSAGKAYQNSCGANSSIDTDIVYTSHPARPFSWNKPLPSLNGKTGKEVFENALETYIKILKSQNSMNKYKEKRNK